MLFKKDFLRDMLSLSTRCSGPSLEGPRAARSSANHHPERGDRCPSVHVSRVGGGLLVGYGGRAAGEVFRSGLHRRSQHEGRADSAVLSARVEGAFVDGSGIEV